MAVAVIIVIGRFALECADLTSSADTVTVYLEPETRDSCQVRYLQNLGRWPNSAPPPHGDIEQVRIALIPFLIENDHELWRDERHFVHESYKSPTLAQHIVHISPTTSARQLADIIMAHMCELWTTVDESLQLTQPPGSSQDDLSMGTSTLDDLTPLVPAMQSAASSAMSASSTGTDVVMHAPHVATPTAHAASASASSADAPAASLRADVAVPLDSDEDTSEYDLY